MNEELEERVQTLARWLYESRYPVVFTGAGISTESGLPDFRGPDGVWTRRDKGLRPRPMVRPWDSVEPNKGHMAVVELRNLGRLYLYAFPAFVLFFTQLEFGAPHPMNKKINASSDGPYELRQRQWQA